MNKAQLKRLIEREVKKTLSERISSGPFSGIQSLTRHLGNTLRLAKNLTEDEREVIEYLVKIGGAFLSNGMTLPKGQLTGANAQRAERLLLLIEEKIAEMKPQFKTKEKADSKPTTFSTPLGDIQVDPEDLQ